MIVIGIGGRGEGGAIAWGGGGGAKAPPPLRPPMLIIAYCERTEITKNVEDVIKSRDENSLHVHVSPRHSVHRSAVTS